MTLAVAASAAWYAVCCSFRSMIVLGRSMSSTSESCARQRSTPGHRRFVAFVPPDCSGHRRPTSWSGVDSIAVSRLPRSVASAFGSPSRGWSDDLLQHREELRRVGVGAEDRRPVDVHPHVGAVADRALDLAGRPGPEGARRRRRTPVPPRSCRRRPAGRGSGCWPGRSATRGCCRPRPRAPRGPRRAARAGRHALQGEVADPADLAEALVSALSIVPSQPRPSSALRRVLLDRPASRRAAAWPRPCRSASPTAG